LAGHTNTCQRRFRNVCARQFARRPFYAEFLRSPSTGSLTITLATCESPWCLMGDLRSVGLLVSCAATGFARVELQRPATPVLGGVCVKSPACTSPCMDSHSLSRQRELEDLPQTLPTNHVRHDDNCVATWVNSLYQHSQRWKITFVVTEDLGFFPQTCGLVAR